MNKHELKTWPPFFDAVVEGKKTFEIRKNDRNFRVGDVLVLQEYDKITESYTGRSTPKIVTYIARDLKQFGLPEDTVVMGFK